MQNGNNVFSRSISAIRFLWTSIFFILFHIFFFNDNRAMNVGLGLPEGVSIYDAKITHSIRCYGLTIVVLLCVPLHNISECVLCILKRLQQ